ncbi:ACP S-malonyltransferase [Candidatus Pelagibacter sp.]|nr:ACP S-malonyltransferase [Candidatus Pelagibacter sp.]MDC1092006.1 ACP S-malonyltransferase [Candidatus Pelagibacter sp.]
MFSVIFPGQGSQMVGMGKEFYEKFDLVKNLFKEADDTLNFSISKLIFEGPKEELDFTINTQPAIFLISYSIYNVINKEFNIDLSKAKYFAGHSLGEYTALSCAGYLSFSDTLKILRIRGDAMQNSVPKGQGGMVAVLGSKVETIEKILKDNEQNLNVQIANDNSEGQIVLSGKTVDLDKLILILKENTIKNIKLPVSAPFHCSLMNKATNIMSDELNKLNFTESENKLISNVTAKEISNTNELKDLLIKQIENRVRWRESVINMINNDINHFIEIGPGKVLSGLVKRINKEVKIDTINNQGDIEGLKI